MGLFDADYSRVPDLLRGRVIESNGCRFIVRAAEGYSKAENAGGLYRPILTKAPGEVYFPRRRNAILFLVACWDGSTIGGCVLVRDLETVGGGIIAGPSNVSTVLGVFQPKATGRVIEQGAVLRLEINHVVHAAAAVGGEEVSGRGIGEEVLRRLMPALCDHYTRHGAGKTFQGMLQELVDQYPTEAKLRRALRS